MQDTETGENKRLSPQLSPMGHFLHISIALLWATLTRRLGLLRNAWVRKTLGLEPIQALPAPEALKALPAPAVAEAAPPVVKERNPTATIAVARAGIIYDVEGKRRMHVIEGTGGPYDAQKPFCFAMPAAGLEYPFRPGETIEIVNPAPREIRMVTLAPAVGGVYMVIEPTAQQAAIIAERHQRALQFAVWRTVNPGPSDLQRMQASAPSVTVSYQGAEALVPKREETATPPAAAPGVVAPQAG